MTFSQFVMELAGEDVTLSAPDVQRLRSRYGDKVMQMGSIEPDGSMRIPIDCVVIAARALRTGTLVDAARSIDNDQMFSLFDSGEALIEAVAAARERKLRTMIRIFQNESDADRSHQQWKQIEKEIFGLEFHD